MTAMKKILYHIGMLAAAALAFAACTKEAEINEPKEEVTHVATISLGKADVSTKTEVIEGETSASYKWLDNDAQYLHVYENGTAGTVTNFSLNADKTVATLTVEFTGNPTAPYTYTAKYAKTLSGSKNPLILNEQNPGTSSFDPAADVLVSKATNDVTNLAERANEFTFNMGRVVTVNKMTLTGLEAGEIISSVEFTLDKHMAGYVSYNAENNIYTYSSGGTKLTLNYTATNGVVPSNGQFPVYFVSAPVDAAGIVSVVVTTDKNVYTKSSSLDPNPFDGKTITFAIGTMKRFTMAMSGYGEEISTGVEYTLVESADDLFDGATYIIVGSDVDYAVGLFTGGNNHPAVAIEKSVNDQNKSIITVDNTVAVEPVLLNKVGSNWTIKNNASDNSYYGQYLICATGKNNRLQETDSESSSLKEWTISISEGVATITNANADAERTQVYYNQNSGASPMFACYAPGQTNNNYHSIALYVDLNTCTPALATPNVLAEVQNNNEIYVTWDEVANADGYIVTCTGEANQNVATGVGEATFTALTDGIYTVTVTAISNDHTSYLDSQAATVEDLLIGTPKGTVDNPYTVAEALAIINGYSDKDKSANEVYVSGIIANVGSYNSSYHSVTYDISDDGTTASTLNIYSGKFVANTNFSYNDQISVSDEEIVYGYLYLYGSTKEMYQNNYIYSLNGKTKALTAGTLTATPDNDNKQITVTWGAATGTENEISYVVTCGTQSFNATAAGSHTFTMADYGTYNVSVEATTSDAVAATINTSATLTDPSAGTPTEYTIEWGASYNSKGVSGYADPWNATKDGFTVNMANFNNNNSGWSYVKCGRKNNASVATIITDAAITEAIKTVTITIDALTAAKINSITLYVSNSKTSGWTSAGTFTKATGNQSVTIASPAANKYYKLEFDCASGSSNGLLTLSKAVFSTN